jgi:hypothetical protein
MDGLARHNSDVIVILLLTIITKLAHSVWVLKICKLNDYGYSYRLVYLVNENIITILAIIHGKRLIENMPDRFD